MFERAEIILRSDIMNFTYDSPINDKPLVILLDILFEENHYQRLLKKPIKMIYFD